MSPREQTRKESIPIVFQLPNLSNKNNNMDASIEKLKNILQNLKLTSEIVSKKKNMLVFNILAYSNTWSNQRRKRRLQKRLLDEKAKQSKIELNSDIITGAQCELVAKESPNKYFSPTVIPIEQNPNTNDGNNVEDIPENIESENHKKEVLVQGIMKTYLKDSAFSIEAEYLNGTAGKDGLHQIIQYIKNNWK